MKKVSKHQTFEMVEMHRSEIKFHPKNPRIITENAKNKLKAKIKDIGLLQPPILNKRTGYLVGGHQRISIMDSLEKYKEGENDYQIDVAVVDLDEKKELEALVFLNNPGAQGGWELELLAEINLDNNIGFGDMGFDKLDVTMLFDGDSRFTEIFPDTQEVKESKASLEEIKAVRKENMESMKEKQKAGFYFVVVCADDKEKRELLKKMNIADYESYVSAEAISAALK